MAGLGEDTEYGDFILAVIPSDGGRFSGFVRRKDNRFFCIGDNCQVVPEVQRHHLVSVMSTELTDSPEQAAADAKLLADMCALELQ